MANCSHIAVEQLIDAASGVATPATALSIGLTTIGIPTGLFPVPTPTTLG